MADEGRAPVFELHIRPMIRLLDREHMSKWVKAFDLWDLSAVWENRLGILAKVRDVQDMPGTRYGGPWPQEWIRLFERWVATGSDAVPGHHLQVAVPMGDYRIQVMGGEKRRVSVDVTVPSSGCRVWFDLESIDGGKRTYTLYLEPAYPPQEPNPTEMIAIEPFTKGDATRLMIRDANGIHEVPI